MYLKKFYFLPTYIRGLWATRDIYQLAVADKDKDHILLIDLSIIIILLDISFQHNLLWILLEIAPEQFLVCINILLSTALIILGST